MVRAKMKLVEVRYSAWTAGMAPMATLKFQPISDTSTPENERFTKATPSGLCEMQVTSEGALAQFKDGEGKWLYGHDFYVDFNPAPAQ